MNNETIFRAENIFLVIGATNDSEKYGSKVFLDLRQAGYNVIAINQHGGEVHDTPAYTSVTEFLQRIEKLFSEEKRHETHAKLVVVLVIPPRAALTVVQEAAEHEITKYWFQPGAESDEALRFCDEHDFTVIHDQCIIVQRPR